MSDSLTRILFHKLVTMSGEDYEKGELVIDRGRIVEARSGVRNSFEGITHDWSDCLILPGFVNAHCHLSLSGLQGKVTRQERFVDWIESVVKENAPNRPAACRGPPGTTGWTPCTGKRKR